MTMMLKFLHYIAIYEGFGYRKTIIYYFDWFKKRRIAKIY